jgi:PAS domain S-box-containing protein
MNTIIKEQELFYENQSLRIQLEEYKELIDAIKNGEIDALAINKDGKHDIFTLESNDLVYRILVENFGESALNVTENGIIVYANTAFENLLGAPGSSIIGAEIHSLVDSKYKDDFAKLFKSAFSGNSKGEIVLRYKDRRVPAYVSLSSLYPRFAGIGIIITDLSEKKQQEEVISDFKSQLSEKEEQLLNAEILQKSIEKFRFMADTMPQKVWTADTFGDVDYVNKQWLDYTHLTLEDIRAGGWSNIIHSKDFAEYNHRWKYSIQTGEIFEFEHRLLAHDGIYRWHLSRAIPQKNEKGQILMWVGTITDVDVQKNFTKKLERKILERTSFIQQVLDSSVEHIATFNKALHYSSLNKTALDYLGIEASKIVGKHVLEVFPHLEGTSTFLCLQKALNGETIYQSNISRLYNDTDIFETYLKPLVVKNEITGVLLMARNISEVINSNIRLEEMNKTLEKKNAELNQSNKELASFSYIASHDLQEPLRKIQTFTGKLLESETNAISERGKDYFKRIMSASSRMQNLINDLLNYSRLDSNKMDFTYTDLNAVIEDVIKNFSDLIEDKKVIINIGFLPSLYVLPLQIHQLFSNLIDNSIKYSKPNYRPCITISAEFLKDYEVKDDSPRDYWKITFTDNGIGFEPAYNEKIFELFSRLHSKMEYSGTGIGLAICKKVVENHHGMIRATGAPGEGTSFQIFIPEKNVAQS